MFQLYLTNCLTLNEMEASTKTLNAEPLISAYLWLMFSLCFLGNIMGGTASTLMSVYLPVLIKDIMGKVSESQLNETAAFINALYFAGWALGGFLWGLVCDRIGRARSLALAIGMFGVFTILTSWASSWELIVLFRFCCGFGVGGMLVINSTLLTETWPENSRAIAIGIVSIGFPIGIFSSGALNYLVSGWRQGFMIGIVPLIIGLISFWVLKESDKWKMNRDEKKEGSTKVNSPVYRKDLVNGSIIFGTMLIGLWAIFSWMPTWVQTILSGANGQHERGLSMMLLGIGGLAGGFASGWISNAVGIKKAMLISFAGCFIMSFILFKTNTTFSAITLIETGLLSFMFGISQGSLSVYIPLLFPVAIRATATGFCFNIGRIFTAAAVFFVGTLVTVLGGYGNSLMIFSSVFLIGFIFLILSKNIKK
jgi:predicted MFS family arabinose efflux permease